MIRRTTTLAAAAALALIPGQVHAALITCSASATGVAFGTVDSAAVAATGSIRVTCFGFGTLNPFTVMLTTGSSGTYSTRRMQSGARTMNYNLYTNIVRTTVFGDGTGGSSNVTEVIDFAPIGTGFADVPVYGRVPAQGLLAPGSYTDTITVTVTY